MRAICLLIFSIVLYSCSPLSKHALTKKFAATESKFQDHVGFALYDIASGKNIYEYNASTYFTPASNTKIFTFYTSLKVIGDSIPALKYLVHNDSLIFQGTGDPSFLYKNVFNNDRVYTFLKSSPHQLYFSTSNFKTTHYGPGWAWDDYNDYYSPERFSFPVYGNIFSVQENNMSMIVNPSYFKKFVSVKKPFDKAVVKRALDSNYTIYNPAKARKPRTWDVPFKVDSLLITTLLKDTLHKEVSIVQTSNFINAKTLYSLPADSLYKVMMQESDNFIAEQLLLICSSILTDTLKPEIAINYAKKNLLADLKDKPVWVDGSGLSRYNLFTPRSIVQLWQKIYETVSQERLFKLLAVGGKSGTIRNWYKGETPYIFGKTGSLSNNHCLSGFLVTKKGKVLIFSFMNNNFTASTTEVRKDMQEILKTIYEHY